MGAAAKRKLENEFSQLQADLDEMAAEAKLSEDKAARAMVDAARLADELRAEQDLAMMQRVGAMLTSQRISGNLSAPSRSWSSLQMKTRKTMNACRPRLTN